MTALLGFVMDFILGVKLVFEEHSKIFKDVNRLKAGESVILKANFKNSTLPSSYRASSQSG